MKTAASGPCTRLDRANTPKTPFFSLIVPALSACFSASLLFVIETRSCVETGPQ